MTNQNSAQAQTETKTAKELTGVNLEAYDILNVNERYQVDNYPYGYKRTTVFYSVEYKAKKGFRTVFQSINPKTDRLNKPKKSTYSDIYFPVKMKQNGHIDYYCLDIRCDESLNKLIHLLDNYADVIGYNEEQRKYLGYLIASRIMLDTKALIIYGGADKEKALESCKEQYQEALKVAKSGDFSIIKNCLLDVDYRNSLKPENFQPFQVKEVYTIGANGMQKIG